MQFLFGEKGIGRRRLRSLAMAGTNACYTHIHTGRATKGMYASKYKYLGPVSI